MHQRHESHLYHFLRRIKSRNCRFGVNFAGFSAAFVLPMRKKDLTSDQDWTYI